MNGTSRRPPLLLLLLLMAGSTPALAQQLQGTVSERGSGIAIAGAVLQLLNADGQMVGGVLTGSSGEYTLTAPSAGRFRLKVDRIGFRSTLSEVLELGPGQLRPFSLQVESEAITLEGITARGRSRGCTVQQQGELLSRVWEEARKALDVVTRSQAASLVTFDTESFRRELDASGRQVRGEERRAAVGRTENPYASVPIAELEEHGYIRVFPDSTTYYAPDAAVLLSDSFVERHCFELTDGEGEDRALIGLSFRPARRDAPPDIEGTLWLDRESSELRSVDFRYVGHPHRVSSSRMGGRIEFERVPSGAWIVRRWVIRMPLIEARSLSFPGSIPRGATRITAFLEQGGEVVAISTAQPPNPVAVSAISGMVLDSLTGEPLSGAIVYLSGTSLADTTDREGRYEIASVPAGSYGLSFMHPKLRALGMLSSPRRVVVGSSSPVTQDLAIPGADAFLQRYCGETGEGFGLVVGVVRDSRTGQPVADAAVGGQWTAQSALAPGSVTRRVTPDGELAGTLENAALDTTIGRAEGRTDEGGIYRLCGVPRNVRVRLDARVGSAIAHFSLLTGETGVTAQDVMVSVQ